MTEKPESINNLIIEGGNEGGFVLNFQKFPLNIVFHDIGSLKPQPDITPLESVQLCMMLVSAHGCSSIDYPAFIKENGLERHFTK